MSCKFVINPTQNIDQVFQQAMDEIKNFGGEFNGNINGGNFNVKALGGAFIGNFKRSGKAIEWEIVSKPFFIPCSVIENFLSGHLP